jgi:NADPH-dependent 2,4-dienoyl-CoA reductase/sulfur reductase-like enzyme
VLVAGASIAGPALAHWLRRRGAEVTVVERAAELRPGGQAVDARGVAKEVVLHDDTRDGVEYVFGDQIAELTQDADGATLTRVATWTTARATVYGISVQAPLPWAIAPATQGSPAPPMVDPAFSTPMAVGASSGVVSCGAITHVQ